MFAKIHHVRSIRLVALIAVALLFVATAPVDLRADTIIDSGTTTVTTGTDFGGNLYVGYSGTATLEVLVGGNAASVDAEIGFNAGSQGTATIAGGTWTNSGSLFVGDMGAGTLDLTDGRVSNTYGYLAAQDGSSGTATVSGGTWGNSNYLIVGVIGRGVLNVSGGTVTNGQEGIIGDWVGSNGTATVSGGTWANSTALIVGSSGTGTLNVTGGSVTSGIIYVGFGTSSSGVGMATVTGGTWANDGDLYLGYDSVGTLNVLGGFFTSGTGYLGFLAGSESIAAVSTGTWANSGDLYVGVSGTGTLSMTGGLLSVAGTLSKGSLGTINLNSGGTLQIGTGGTTGVLDVGVLANNGTLIFNRSDAYTYSGVLSGSGAVTKQGAGQLVFDGANSYSGLTTNSGGTIALSGTGSIGTGGLSLGTGGVFDITALASSTYSLPATGNLTGAGTLAGIGHTLEVLGSFLPGSSAGTVTVGSGLTLDLGSSGSSAFQITSPSYTAGTFDLVNGDGSVLLGGVLNLDFSGGAYANGVDVLRLFTNTGGLSGSFSAVNFEGLGAGQSATFNPVTGFISLVPEPSTCAMALAGLACGGSVAFRRRKRS
jgi:T5SS/PEP-CTERM-associated repeat protein